jgi:hypothetical protein
MFIYIYIYIYKMLRYVSVQGSAVSGLQERNKTYQHKICHATYYTTPSIAGGILQSRYQVLLLSCNMFVRSHCRLHYTHINHLHTIPSIVGGILQSVLNLIQCVKVLRGCTYQNLHSVTGSYMFLSQEFDHWAH